ncbi:MULTISPECIES: neutral zinc metallopeptidase [Actinoalloteichus]|uniref:Neutral zinc metallopeptidase n=1 Tax=Actinoalloteichus fjordicus TaxID=1612552 RepID=A0AAC9PQE7_9PSEU|nr:MULTISPECIES: neutral zinc metallopeptidase [Actinoalloteichus]APU13039.1 Putative neutral zinc metallopeptidase [Actinoalloteichus fjordicus]APU19012.1 Putative neutral zinc metallopeptidase [Actinoalloteichus sp. GBA129-24]
MTGPIRLPLPPPRSRAEEPATAPQPIPRSRAQTHTGYQRNADGIAGPVPQQSRAPGLLITLGLGVAGLALVGVIGAMANSALDASRQTAGPTRAAPTAEPPPAQNTPQPPTTPTTTEVETEEPEPTYEEPVGSPQPVYLLGDHPINADGMYASDTTACTLAPFSRDHAGQDALYQSALPCMVDAWRYALESNNLPATPPELITVSGPVETPCGTANSSYYCSGNHTLYMSASVHADQEQLGDHPGPYLSVLFHEYGHHVQGLAGIMQAAWDERYAVGPNSPEGLEISRRLELQATCYGGMLLAATTRTGVVDLDTMSIALRDARNRGDWPDRGAPPDHGAPEINGGWMEQGYYNNNTQQCNTWLATPADVR